MRFFRRPSKRGKGGAIAGKKDLVSPEKIAKVGPTDALIERLTALKAAGADVVLRERRLTGAAGESTGFIGTKHIVNLDPMRYEDDLNSRHGGGAYQISLMSKGKTIMVGGDEGVPELYTVEIAGPPKIEKKEKKEPQPKSTAEKVVESVMASFQSPEVMGPLVAAATNALTGRNSQVDQTQVTTGILDIIVKVKDIFSSPAPDPMSQIREVAAAAKELAGLFTPPITPSAGQPSGGGTLETLARIALPTVERLFGPAMTGQGGLPWAGDGSQSPAGSATPAGSAAPGAALPLSAGQRPGGEVMETPAQEAKLPVIDGLGQLRRMVAGGVDAGTAGEYAARVIDAFVDLSAPEGVPPQWREYLTNPTLAVEVLPQIIPELPARGAEYQEEFLGRAVEVFNTWAEQLSEDESNAVQSDDTEDGAAKTQEKEPGEGGGQSEGSGVDEGHDADGALD